MLTANGRVAAIEADILWIDTPRASACGNCSLRRGCGVDLLGALSGSGSHRVAARRGDAVQGESFAVGDSVVIAVPDGALAEASLRAWLLPLVLLVAGLIAGGWLGGPDAEWAAATGALLGLGAGWLALRVHQRRLREQASRFLPVVTARPPAGAPGCAAATGAA